MAVGSGGGLEAVLAAHWEIDVDNDRDQTEFYCDGCKETLLVGVGNVEAAHQAHVAAMIAAHLEAVAGDESVREACADAIFAATETDLRKRLEDANWVAGYDSEYADVAVAAFIKAVTG